MSFRNLFILLFGVGLIVACLVSAYRDCRFATSGKEAPGFVTNTWETMSKGGAVTHCAYRFKADGNWYSGEDLGHRTGDRIQVVYLWNDPAVSRLSTTHALFPLGVLELVLGAFMIFMALTRVR